MRVQIIDKILIPIIFIIIIIWGFTKPNNAFDLSDKEMVGLGAALFDENGCYACHSLDGSRKIGPSLRGVWGRLRPLEDGSTILINSNYIYESIINPEAKIAKGYTAAAMPSYKDLITEKELIAIIKYLENN